MVDQRFQGNTYGRQAMERALELVRTSPYGEAEEVFLSYEPNNHAARKLYASLGFRERGELKDGEQAAYLRL